MKRFSIGAALVFCMFALCLAGCSPAPSTSADAESLKGFWVLDESAQLGFDAVLNLDEEDFAELMVADAYLEGTWKTDGTKATLTFEEASGKTGTAVVSEITQSDIDKIIDSGNSSGDGSSQGRGCLKT